MTEEVEQLEEVPVATPEAVEPVEKPQADQVEEAEARRAGWRPKEEYQGDPAKWVEASEFNRRGREHVPILRDKVKRLEGRVQELLDANRQFGEFQKSARDAERKRLQGEIENLKAQQLNAVQAGDTQTYLATEQQIKARTEAIPKDEPPAPVQPTLPVEVREFVEQNPWMDTDPAMRRKAVALHQAQLSDPDDHRPLNEKLAEVGNEMRRLYPHKFGNPNRVRPAAVDGGAAITPVKSSRRGYSDLPAEAKAACDKYVKTIPGYSREKYLADYYAGE